MIDDDQKEHDNAYDDDNQYLDFRQRVGGKWPLQSDFVFM